MEYFVLALFINAVVSNPYYVLKNSGLDEHNTKKSNHEFNVARNEEYYLAHNEPSFMSPVPTKRDRDNEVITINPRMLRDPHGLEQSIVTKFENERNIDEIRENVQNYRQASSRTKHAQEVSPISENVVKSRSYSNPSSVIDENIYLLNRLNHQNKPLANSVVSSPGLRNERQSTIEKRDIEVLRHHQTLNNQQPLRIQARPENRIVFQESVVPDLKNIELYKQGMPAKRIDLHREWSKISNEKAHLPDWLTERLKYPVDFPRDSQQSASTVQRPDIHKIITDPRIHNVITSTKQTKRYMVIHPDGTVEHVDSLEPISEKHPNYVLVNAEQFHNNDKSIEGTNQNKPIPSVSEPVSLNLKSSNSVEKPQAVDEDISKKVSLPAAVIKKVTFSEPPIIPQTIVSSSSTSDSIIELPPTITSEITEVSWPVEKPQAVLEVIHKKEAVQIIPTAVNEKVSEPTRIPQPTVVSSSTVADIISPTIISKTTIKTLETAENTNKINKPVNDEIEDENITACNNNSNIITSNNEADENVDVAEPISQDVTTAAKINESAHDITSQVETTPITEIIKTGDDSKFSLENAKTSDATVQSTQNVENAVDEANEVTESPCSGGPVVFDTSDPDFWKKVTEGRDTDSIFFFLFKSGPKVEKDTVRTVFPDGSVLEELTETVWEEGAEPKITKSLNVIPPGGL